MFLPPLQGAQELTKNFEQGPPEANAVLSFAAVRCMLFERGIRGLDFRWWQPSLRGFAPFSPSAQTSPGLRVNMIAERPRCDPLPQLAEVQAAEIKTARQAERERGEPTIDVLLPSTQVMVLGQLLQFFALLAALEKTMPVMPSGESC